jgi:pilus assembly protein CpaE
VADNPTVLIIDQNPENRAELPRLLQQATATVIASSGYGVEAPTALAESKPQLVFLSLEEPVTRGLQTMSLIGEVAPNTPIVVYSSFSDGATIRKAMLAGAWDFLTTPLTPDALQVSIESVMDRLAQREQQPAGPGDAMTPGGMVLTIFGAKGGIGKTTVATNLSTALHRETGQSVALVDMDTRFGDVAVMLDLPAERTLTEVARDYHALNRSNIRDYLVPHPSGIAVLPAPQNPSEWESIEPEHIERIVRVLAQTFDYVVLDTPGTFNEIVGISLELATIVLMLTSLDVSSIKDTAMALSMLRSWSFPEEKIKLLINHANIANSIHDADVARTLDYEIFWQIPFDKAASRAGQLGLPVVLASPRSRVAQNLGDLARLIGGVSSASARRQNGPLGSLGRMLLHR